MPSSFHAFVFFILCASLAHRLSIILVPSCTLDMLANPVPTALRWGTPMFKWIYVQLSDGGERGVWWCNWCLCLVALPIKCIPEALFLETFCFQGSVCVQGPDRWFFLLFFGRGNAFLKLVWCFGKPICEVSIKSEQAGGGKNIPIFLLFIQVSQQTTRFTFICSNFPFI